MSTKEDEKNHRQKVGDRRCQSLTQTIARAVRERSELLQSLNDETVGRKWGQDDLQRAELVFQIQQAKIEDLRLFEDRMRQHYDMFRDIVKEENTLIHNRQQTFGTVTGFLFAAIGLSLREIGESKTTSIIITLFICFVAATGLAVTWWVRSRVQDAENAIENAVRGWEDCQSDYLNVHGGDDTSYDSNFPNILGLSKVKTGGYQRYYHSPFHWIFKLLWGTALFLGICLLVLIARDVIF
jgi:hypothetical protein